jgi:hypothetical protein
MLWVGWKGRSWTGGGRRAAKILLLRRTLAALLRRCRRPPRRTARPQQAVPRPSAPQPPPQPPPHPWTLLPQPPRAFTPTTMPRSFPRRAHRPAARQAAHPATRPPQVLRVNLQRPLRRTAQLAPFSDECVLDQVADSGQQPSLQPRRAVLRLAGSWAADVVPRLRMSPSNPRSAAGRMATREWGGVRALRTLMGGVSACGGRAP